jgi:hypothetical protein
VPIYPIPGTRSWQRYGALAPSLQNSGRGRAVGYMLWLAGGQKGNSGTNVTVAEFPFLHSWPWLMAALGGIAIRSVWNFVVGSIFAWGKKHQFCESITAQNESICCDCFAKLKSASG